jgi:hypothetical protein
MCGVCGECDKIRSCKKLKKIVISHKIMLYEFVPFATSGLVEIYGDGVMAKVFILLDRFRKSKGYIYLFKGIGADVYKRKEDLPKNSFSSFVLNPISGFYEFDLSQGKLLSA